MIWIDIATPKYAMFFSEMIKELEARGHKILVTTRYAKNYTEAKEILDLHGIANIVLGEYGGATLIEKFEARIERQKEILNLFEEKGFPKVLLCGAVVDSVQVAYGIGIPVVNFCDIPVIGHTNDIDKASAQSRLTVPISTKIFHPFMVPADIFENLGVKKQNIIQYDFLDVVMWLKKFTPSRRYYNDFLKKYNINNGKPIILAREEEFKASYVQKKVFMLYEALEIVSKRNKFNIVVIPRYESENIQKILPFATVIEEKIKVQHLLAFCDLFIGGGGTLNSEACYFGTATISTRSFVAHYDKYLIDNGLMIKVNNKDELVDAIYNNISKKNIEKAQRLQSMEIDIEKLIALCEVEEILC